MLFLLLASASGVLILMAAWIASNHIGSQRADYTIHAASEIEPFVRSWGQWLETRGRIVVRQSTSGAEAEFRKKRFKTRAEVLIFRYRNADSSGEHFEEVRSRFDREGVEYGLERTRKQARPRAIAVSLDPADVFTPIAASRLLTLSFVECGSGLQVICQGRFRRAPDAPSVRKIPPNRAYRAGSIVGRWLARLLALRRAA
jgi:hypothetical protein